MEKFYCIYENKEFDVDQASSEHIIPLSLGGCNLFTINVSSKKNSQLGTCVDGELAKDPFITYWRMERNLKGHSKKPAETIFKKAYLKDTKKH